MKKLRFSYGKVKVCIENYPNWIIALLFITIIVVAIILAVM